MAKEIGKIMGGNQWSRVVGTPTSADEKARCAATKSTRTQHVFMQACGDAGIDITNRQARKWNNKKGAAYNLSHNIEMNGFVVPSV